MENRARVTSQLETDARDVRPEDLSTAEHVAIAHAILTDPALTTAMKRALEKI